MGSLIHSGRFIPPRGTLSVRLLEQPCRFQSYTSTSLRTLTDEKGNPWFVAADVCRVLDINGTTNAIRILDDKEIALYKVKGQKGLPVNCISESGLYKLIMRSNEPQAKPFQNTIVSAWGVL